MGTSFEGVNVAGRAKWYLVFMGRHMAIYGIIGLISCPESLLGPLRTVVILRSYRNQS